MADRFGRCINFGACGKADANENIPYPSGVIDASCPECGKTLSPLAVKARGGPPLVAIGIAVVVLLLIVGFVMRKGALQQPTSQSSPVPIAAAPSASTNASAQTLLSLCGSNTIGSQLGPDLIHDFLDSIGASSVSQHDSGSDTRVVTGQVAGKDEQIDIAAHGSATAFSGLRSGDCQIGMASRRVKAGEAATLARIGNMLLPASEHVIGLDGIAVIVNQANPVSSLTVAQLNAVYTGKIKNWRGVGGNDGDIVLYARDDKSGTFDTFKSLVLDSGQLAVGTKRLEDSTALSSAVEHDPHAIGFIGLPYVGQTKALRIASGGAAIAPTPLTVGRETYPLTRRLFLYTAASPSNPHVSRFVKFVQSDKGQEIVNRDGFVGTITSLATTHSSSKNLPAGAPPQYRKLVDAYDQASFNFYFNTGSDILDNKALVDVGRLVSLMSTSAARNKSVVLAGFADSTGDSQANIALSLNRANAASKELQAEGIRVQSTIGFGQELPIRDNSTESGREKNRRVEIFITR